MRVPMLRIRGVLLLAAALSLSGCFARASAPTIRHYRLSYAPPRIEASPAPIVLRIAPLRIDAVYASEAILYREGEFHVEAYSRHRWSADPARMITDLLQRDLAASGAFRAVQQGPSTLPSDYILRGEIEEIEEQSLPECRAHLRLRFLLTRANARASADSVAFQKVYTVDEPTRCGHADALVEAMSRALARLSEQLLGDVLAAVGASENPR